MINQFKIFEMGCQFNKFEIWAKLKKNKDEVSLLYLKCEFKVFKNVKFEKWTQIKRMKVKYGKLVIYLKCEVNLRYTKCEVLLNYMLTQIIKNT